MSLRGLSVLIVAGLVAWPLAVSAQQPDAPAKTDVKEDAKGEPAPKRKMVKPEDVKAEPAPKPEAEPKADVAPKRSESPGTCVVLDEARDGLTAGDRRGALTFLRMNFKKKGKTLAIDNCTETYTLYHVVLGDTVTAIIEGPTRTLDFKVSSLDDLPGAYSQLVNALVDGTSLARATDRKNVTEDQSDPKRVKADSLFYFGLGYGAMEANDLHDGPVTRFGYRYELDWIAVDLSMDAPAYDTNDSGPSVAAFMVGLNALYYFDPSGDLSPYAGLGLGYGFISEPYDEYSDRDGSGLVGRLSVGYEFLRSSTIRLMVQVDASLPMFTLKPSENFYYDEPAPQQTDDESIWAPSVGATLAIGWNRPAQRGCSCSTLSDGKSPSGWAALLGVLGLAGLLWRRRS